MSERNIVAAVDLGTNTAICILGSDTGNKKIEILGQAIIASGGVRRGTVLNVKEAVKVVNKVVEKAGEHLDFQIKKLYVNIAGQHLKTIERELSKSIEHGKMITQSDVRELFEEARATPLDDDYKVYHVINQSYTVNDEEGVHNPIGIRGDELTATYRLIVGPANYEEALRASLEQAGFEMVKCVVNPVAAAEAVLSEDEKEAGVVLLDLGGGTTSISIYYDNVMRHLSVIPFGGNVVSNDIREGCSILLRQAEALKVKYGSAMGELVDENSVVTIPKINGWEPREISFKSLAYIIQARLEEILEGVYYQIEKSNYDDKLGAGIVLTGGGAKLNGIRQLVQYKTGMDVRIGKPMNGIISEDDKQYDSPQYATAFGLLKKAVNDKNAQNDELITKKRKKKPKSNYGEAIMQSLALFFNEEKDAEF